MHVFSGLHLSLPSGILSNAWTMNFWTPCIWSAASRRHEICIFTCGELTFLRAELISRASTRVCIGRELRYYSRKCWDGLFYARRDSFERFAKVHVANFRSLLFRLKCSEYLERQLECFKWPFSLVRLISKVQSTSLRGTIFLFSKANAASVFLWDLLGNHEAFTTL